MLRKNVQSLTIFVIPLLAAILLAACTGTQTPGVLPGVAEPTLTETVAIPPTETPIPTPTQTPEPLALRVNGEGLTLAEYEADLRQLEEAHQQMGKIVPPKEQSNLVLTNFTDLMLLAQGAAEAGYQLDDAALQTEIDRLAQSLGGAQGLADWIAQRGYSETTFRAALARQMAAAWQRDQIIAAVPPVAEQIHLRQILTQDESIAKRAYEQVHIPGVIFSAQAYRYDTITGGDLGWFPRGYLLQPEVEEAAFQLQPGEISPVIKSSVGYHIVQVIAREPSRPVSPDAYRVLQHKALEDWLKARRDASSIEILIP